MPEILTTDGVRIAYSTWGRRGESPILAIQGLGVDSRGWALQRGAFGRQHQCLATDNRGTGRSDAPPGRYAVRLPTTPKIGSGLTPRAVTVPRRESAVLDFRIDTGIR